MRLDTFCPWKEHLYGLEEELGIAGEVLYCLYEVQYRRCPALCPSCRHPAWMLLCACRARPNLPSPVFVHVWPHTGPALAYTCT